MEEDAHALWPVEHSPADHVREHCAR
jgi:hypothetical protein